MPGREENPLGDPHRFADHADLVLGRRHEQQAAALAGPFFVVRLVDHARGLALEDHALGHLERIDVRRVEPQAQDALVDVLGRDARVHQGTDGGIVQHVAQGHEMEPGPLDVGHSIDGRIRAGDNQPLTIGLARVVDPDGHDLAGLRAHHLGQFLRPDHGEAQPPRSEVHADLARRHQFELHRLLELLGQGVAEQPALRQHERRRRELEVGLADAGGLAHEAQHVKRAEDISVLLLLLLRLLAPTRRSQDHAADQHQRGQSPDPAPSRVDMCGSHEPRV